MKQLLLAVLFAVGFSTATRAAETSPIRLGSALGDRDQTVAFTNAVPLSTTESTLVGSGVDIRNWKHVGLQFAFTGMAAGATNVTLTFVRSSSGGTVTPATAVYETTPTLTWTVAANGTTPVVAVTNLPLDTIAGTSFIKLKSIATGGMSITNLAATIVRKRD